MEQNNELQHHGVPGQRWGFRRYQNKDGSLTPAGRRRAEKLKSQYLSVTGKQLKGRALATKSKKTQEVKKEEKIKEISKKKNIKEMSDDELKSITERMTLEKNYIDAKTSLKTVRNSRHVSKGKALSDLVLSEMIKPASINIGKQAFSSLFAYGLNKGFKLDNTEYKVFSNNKKKDK